MDHHLHASGSFNGFQVPLSSNSTYSVGAGSGNNPNGTPAGNDGSNQCMVREQDRFMPIANVIRIMRKVLPAHAKISDDAKETIQECVSEYISFITSEANERCQREQRKTITAEDVLWAMSKLGFDNYIEPLTLFLHRYREAEGDHRGSIRGEPLPALKRTTPTANLAPLQPAAPLPLPHAMAGDAIPQPPISFLHPFGVYGDHMMGGGYYFGMSSSLSPHVGGAGAGAGTGDGDGAGASNSQSQHPGAFDPYAGYK